MESGSPIFHEETLLTPVAVRKTVKSRGERPGYSETLIRDALCIEHLIYNGCSKTVKRKLGEIKAGNCHHRRSNYRISTELGARR